ncbi:MAG: hypothetical protein A2534_00495 [Candidatus Magasanikbacteria bacterium RIFOXYD2_FULL_39_9]|uniref:Uncharacterized protein n=1 Tax=Candidatus Magasanikbacteria bacterium RIFOXYD1_FULL_40_23 TaxID=1798705 RepID=A0A1F6PA57_9BACT|nr:MAG: hypothetical protein A2534_00495 [Candidatus Magasanikbacteria bacterium RIFOXYD2_FULL_39_9]OGH93052.1 MAG: hypothetical protein A2563_04720 [Candidatus Magasanikbacteria bacterium RIFOXYD1_FULL_40_23]
MKKISLVIIFSLSFLFGIFESKDALALISCRCQQTLTAISSEPRSICQDDLDYQDCSQLVSSVIAADPTVTITCVTLNNTYCNGSPRAVGGEESAAGGQGGQASGESTGCEPGRNGQEVCKLTNPIASTEVSQIVSTVIKAMLGIIGGLTLLMFVYGGFRWLTSAGNPEKVKSGSQTMIWAVIGVMLVLASYILLSTFLDFLTGKAT